MNIFNLLYWVIFGGLIGFFADLIDKKHEGSLITNIIVGIVGAVVGGWIAGIVGGLLGFKVEEGFNLVNIIFSVIGALVVLAIYRLFTNKS